MSSLRDVANELNVSVSLVSKVLNNRLGTTGARPDLIEKIHATAQRMGYRKNFNALSLLAKRQNAIAVFIHRVGTAGSSMIEKLIEGIAEETGTLSQRINLQFFEDPEEFREKSSGMHSGMVDGIIVTGVRHPELREDLRKFQKEGLPIITVYNEPIHRSIINIGIPDEALTDAATSHLIEQGCRKIVHLAVSQARTRGYRNALRRAGIRCRSELIVKLPEPDGYFAPCGREAIAQLIEAGIEFDGVCGQSDTQAVGALNELIMRGKRVPEDVKVIGIDNAPFTEFCIVPLSSASQRLIQRGKLAVQMMERIVAKETVETVLLEAMVYKRESTAR